MSTIFFSEKIDTIIRVLIYVLIFWIPYSPAVIEICVVLGSGLWVIKRLVDYPYENFNQLTFRNKIEIFIESFKPKPSYLNQPISYFVLFCILSATGSPFWEQSIHNFFSKTFEWFIIYFLVIEVFTEKKYVYWGLSIFAFTSFSTALDSMYQFHISQRDIFLGHTIQPGASATAGFKTPNDLGGYLTIVIPFFVSLVLFKCNKPLTFLFILLSISGFWSLTCTSSRGSLTATLIGTTFFFILLMRKRFAKVTLMIFLGIILFCTISAFLLKDEINLFHGIRSNTVYWRLDVWKDSLAMIKDRPIFGHGTNTFMQLLQEYRSYNYSPTYAHNCYIQVMAETGVIGLICFLWILSSLFKNSMKQIFQSTPTNRNLKILATGLLAGFLSFLIHSFSDTNFYSLQLSSFFWVMVGVQSVICSMLNKKNICDIK